MNFFLFIQGNLKPPNFSSKLFIHMHLLLDDIFKIIDVVFNILIQVAFLGLRVDDGLLLQEFGVFLNVILV